MTAPPPLQLDLFDCRASIDYLSIAVPGKRPSFTPKLTGLPKWHWKKGDSVCTLTVHDPSTKDIKLLVTEFGNPVLMGLELSVDFWPKTSVPKEDRDSLLRETFVAIGARFRPEDEAGWGYGARGGVTAKGQKPKDFHQRMPDPEELLFYGDRDARIMQAKAYFKRVDQNAALPESEHRVRLELTVYRFGLSDLESPFQIGRLGALIGYPFRRKFTKHFRIVAGVRLRENRPIDPTERREREKRMNRAWATAGVGKFAVDPKLPPDTLVAAVKKIRQRSKKQLPKAEYVLLRHQQANAKIGDALKNLERRMR